MYLLQLFLDHFHWFCTISSSNPTFKWNLLCRASSKCWCFSCWLYWIGSELSPIFIAYPSEKATKSFHKIKMVCNFYLPGNDFWEARKSIEYTDPSTHFASALPRAGLIPKHIRSLAIHCLLSQVCLQHREVESFNCMWCENILRKVEVK